MVGRVRAWRISGSICLGIAFGIMLWLVLPCPEVPHVTVSEVAHYMSLAATAGEIRERGMPVDAREARVVFVGDIMLDRTVATRAREAGDLAYPFKKLPAAWFDSFDYAVGNLEGPVTDRRRPPQKSIDFQFDPAFIPVLKAQGFDAFSQANNHALDQGASGYEDSMRRLREAGFLAFGHQVLDGEIALATATIKGIRFAFLGYNTTDNPLDRAAAAPVIASASSSSDVLIAYLHWGAEYKDRPDAASIELAHWLIDQGVDIVIGAHPHWARGFSTYKGRPIAWSLGNFIFDQDWSVQTRQGLALAITVKSGLVQFEPIPIQIDESQPVIVDGIEKAKRLEALAAISDPDLRDQIRAGKMGF